MAERNTTDPMPEKSDLGRMTDDEWFCADGEVKDDG